MAEEDYISLIVDEEEEEEEFITNDDWVNLQSNVDPIVYMLSGASPNLDKPLPEQVKSQNIAKATLAGLTLNNYDYQPDDMWSAEGAAWMIGSLAPFYLFYQTGNALGARVAGEMLFGARAARAGTAGGIRNLTSPGRLDKYAEMYRDTWASFVPQVGVEAGLWTVTDPHIEGPKGFQEALAYTALGQTAAIGIRNWIRGPLGNRKQYRNRTKDMDNSDAIMEAESAVQAGYNQAINTKMKKTAQQKAGEKNLTNINKNKQSDDDILDAALEGLDKKRTQAKNLQTQQENLAKKAVKEYVEDVDPKPTAKDTSMEVFKSRVKNKEAREIDTAAQEKTLAAIDTKLNQKLGTSLKQVRKEYGKEYSPEDIQAWIKKNKHEDVTPEVDPAVSKGLENIGVDSKAQHANTPNQNEMAKTTVPKLTSMTTEEQNNVVKSVVETLIKKKDELMAGGKPKYTLNTNRDILKVNADKNKIEELIMAKYGPALETTSSGMKKIKELKQRVWKELPEDLRASIRNDFIIPGGTLEEFPQLSKAIDELQEPEQTLKSMIGKGFAQVKDIKFIEVAQSISKLSQKIPNKVRFFGKEYSLFDIFNPDKRSIPMSIKPGNTPVDINGKTHVIRTSSLDKEGLITMQPLRFEEITFISGGQTGVDKLVDGIAKNLGFKGTGGVKLAGKVTSDNRDAIIKRTLENAKDSDITFYFTDRPGSGGFNLTKHGTAAELSDVANERFIHINSNWNDLTVKKVAQKIINTSHVKKQWNLAGTHDVNEAKSLQVEKFFSELQNELESIAPKKKKVEDVVLPTFEPLNGQKLDGHVIREYLENWEHTADGIPWLDTTQPIGIEVKGNITLHTWPSKGIRNVPRIANNEIEKMGWKVFPVDSQGDEFGKQFSALNAKFTRGPYKGLTVEKAWFKVKGAGKGQESPKKGFNYLEEYTKLWEQWARQNPKLINELGDRAVKEKWILVDRFNKTENNQARALTEVIHNIPKKIQYEPSPFSVRFIDNLVDVKPGTIVITEKSTKVSPSRYNSSNLRADIKAKKLIPAEFEFGKEFQEYIKETKRIQKDAKKQGVAYEALESLEDQQLREFPVVKEFTEKNKGVIQLIMGEAVRGRRMVRPKTWGNSLEATTKDQLLESILTNAGFTTRKKITGLGYAEPTILKLDTKSDKSIAATLIDYMWLKNNTFRDWNVKQEVEQVMKKLEAEGWQIKINNQTARWEASTNHKDKIITVPHPDSLDLRKAYSGRIAPGQEENYGARYYRPQNIGSRVKMHDLAKNWTQQEFWNFIVMHELTHATHGPARVLYPTQKTAKGGLIPTGQQPVTELKEFPRDIQSLITQQTKSLQAINKVLSSPNVKPQAKWDAIDILGMIETKGPLERQVDETVIHMMRETKHEIPVVKPYDPADPAWKKVLEAQEKRTIPAGIINPAEVGMGNLNLGKQVKKLSSEQLTGTKVQLVDEILEDQSGILFGPGAAEWAGTPTGVMISKNILGVWEDIASKSIFPVNFKEWFAKGKSPVPKGFKDMPVFDADLTTLYKIPIGKPKGYRAYTNKHGVEQVIIVDGPGAQRNVLKLPQDFKDIKGVTNIEKIYQGKRTQTTRANKNLAKWKKGSIAYFYNYEGQEVLARITNQPKYQIVDKTQFAKEGYSSIREYNQNYKEKMGVVIQFEVLPPPRNAPMPKEIGTKEDVWWADIDRWFKTGRNFSGNAWTKARADWEAGNISPQGIINHLENLEYVGYIKNAAIQDTFIEKLQRIKSTLIQAANAADVSVVSDIGNFKKYLTIALETGKFPPNARVVKTRVPGDIVPDTAPMWKTGRTTPDPIRTVIKDVEGVGMKKVKMYPAQRGKEDLYSPEGKRGEAPVDEQIRETEFADEITEIGGASYEAQRVIEDVDPKTGTLYKTGLTTVDIDPNKFVVLKPKVLQAANKSVIQQMYIEQARELLKKDTFMLEVIHNIIKGSGIDSQLMTWNGSKMVLKDKQYQDLWAKWTKGTIHPDDIAKTIISEVTQPFDAWPTGLMSKLSRQIEVNMETFYQRLWTELSNYTGVSKDLGIEEAKATDIISQILKGDVEQDVLNNTLNIFKSLQTLPSIIKREQAKLKQIVKPENMRISKEETKYILGRDSDPSQMKSIPEAVALDTVGKRAAGYGVQDFLGASDGRSTTERLMGRESYVNKIFPWITNKDRAVLDGLSGWMTDNFRKFPTHDKKGVAFKDIPDNLGEKSISTVPHDARGLYEEFVTNHKESNWYKSVVWDNMEVGKLMNDVHYPFVTQGPIELGIIKGIHGLPQKGKRPSIDWPNKAWHMAVVAIPDKMLKEKGLYGLVPPIMIVPKWDIPRLPTASDYKTFTNSLIRATNNTLENVQQHIRKQMNWLVNNKDVEDMIIYGGNTKQKLDTVPRDNSVDIDLSKAKHGTTYNYIDKSLQNFYSKTQSPSAYQALKEAGLITDEVKLTQELESAKSLIVDEYLAGHAAKNLDKNHIKTRVAKAAEKIEETVGVLEKGEGLNRLQKEKLNSLEQKFNLAADAAEVGANPNNPLEVIKKRRAAGDLAKNLDKITGYDGKEWKELLAGLEDDIRTIDKLGARTGRLDTGTSKQLQESLTIIDGLNTLLGSHSYNAGIQQQFFKSLGKNLANQSKQMAQGKNVKYGDGQLSVKQQEDVRAGIQTIMNNIAEVTKKDIANAIPDITLENVRRPEFIKMIDKSWNKLIDNDIASWITDLPDYQYKTLYTNAQQAGDEAALTQIRGHFKTHLLNNPNDFARLAFRTNQEFTAAKIWNLKRVSIGADADIGMYHKLVAAEPLFSKLSLYQQLRTLDNTVDTMPYNTRIEAGGEALPIESIRGGQSFRDGSDGIPPGADPGDGGYVSTFTRYWARRLWSQPKHELYLMSKKYGGEKVFIELHETYRRAEQWIEKWLFTGPGARELSGNNIIKEMEKPGRWLDPEFIPALERVHGKEWVEQKVLIPSLEEAKHINKSADAIRSEHNIRFKKEMIQQGYWKGDADELTYAEFLRQTLDPTSRWRNPDIMAMKAKDDMLMRQRLKTNLDNKLNAIKDKQNLIYKDDKGISRNYIHETLVNFRASLDDIRTITNNLRRQADDWGMEMQQKSPMYLHEDIKDVGDIPGYFPIILDGPLDVYIRVGKIGEPVGAPILIANARNHADAHTKLHEWAKNEYQVKGITDYDLEGAKVIITSSDHASASTFMEPQTANQIMTGYEVTGKDLKSALMQTDPLSGQKIDIPNIIPYIASTARHRSLNGSMIGPHMMFEEILMKYAYKMGKDGAFAMPSVQTKYLQDVALRGLPDTADAKYLQALHDGIVGRVSSFEETMNDTLNGMLEILQKIPVVKNALDKAEIYPGSNNFRRLTSGITGLSSFIALGFNPATALLQLTITGTNVLPLVGFKNLINAWPKIKHVGKKKGGMYDHYKYIYDSMGLSVLRNDGTVLDIYRNASASLVTDPDRGVLKQTKMALSRDVKDWPQWRKDSWERVRDLSMVMFHKGDRFPRMWTAIAARDMAEGIYKSIQKKMNKIGRKKFMAEPESYLRSNEREMWKRIVAHGLDSDLSKKVDKVGGILDDYAIQFTGQTNHWYNASQVPLLFTETAARPFLQFKTWVQKQTMFYVDQWAERPKNLPLHQEYADFMNITGAMVAMGGLFSLPGMQELDAVLSYNFGVSPKAWFLQHDSVHFDILTAGIPASTGLSLEGRMGPGDLTTTVDTTNLFGIYPARLYKAVGAFAEGNPERALNYTIPKAAQNIRQGWNLLTTGKLESSYDRSIMLDYERMDENPLYAAILKMVGFEHMHESRYRNLKFALNDKSRFTRRQRMWALNEINEAIGEGRILDAKELAKAANIRWSQVTKNYKKKYMYDEGLTKTWAYSSSNPDIKEAQERLRAILNRIEGGTN